MDKLERQLVDEDAYAARVAREYANFVYVRPFYEFHFAHALKGLWKETSFWGPHPIRKLERKAILSVDYGLQSIYARNSGKGQPSDLWSRINGNLRLDRDPPDLFSKISSHAKNKKHRRALLHGHIPRYQEFTDLALRWAKMTFISCRSRGTTRSSSPPSCKTGPTKRRKNTCCSSSVPDAAQCKEGRLECRVRDLHLVLNDLATRGIRWSMSTTTEVPNSLDRSPGEEGAKFNAAVAQAFRPEAFPSRLGSNQGSKRRDCDSEGIR